jgi:hypothetical protein
LIEQLTDDPKGSLGISSDFEKKDSNPSFLTLES